VTQSLGLVEVVLKVVKEVVILRVVVLKAVVLKAVVLKAVVLKAVVLKAVILKAGAGGLGIEVRVIQFACRVGHGGQAVLAERCLTWFQLGLERRGRRLGGRAEGVGGLEQLEVGPPTSTRTA
jgi:hypothetical protein